MATVLAFVLKYKKWFMYAGIALLVLLCIRWYGNREWAKGVDFGDNRTQIKMAKEYEAKWKDAQKQLDLEKERLKTAEQANDANRSNIAAREEELRLSRQNIAVVLKNALSMAQASVAAGYNAAGTTPDAALVSAIRAISADLERDRAAGAVKP
jgi:hypothetical protein